MTKIMVVEDEFSINDILSLALKKEGYDVKSCFSGEEALENIESFSPDLILLDVMLPGIDGIEVCKKISDRYMVIMVTAKNDIFDRIIGLEIGADDYITKPFNIKEVLVRIKVILRTAEKVKRKDKVDYISLNEAVKANVSEESVYYNEKPVVLKRKERELFFFLFKNRNRILSREQILDKVWGYDYYGGTRTVDVHIRRIREKIKDEEGNIIETVFGTGYLMR